MDVRLIRDVCTHRPRAGQRHVRACSGRCARCDLPGCTSAARLATARCPGSGVGRIATAACACAAVNLPFVIGPNMLFANWTTPCAVSGERELCNAASCRLQFTESAWYRDWILAHCGPAMRAPIVLWPYPIDPLPGGPLAPCYDLLIYEKSGFCRELPRQLSRRWPASVRVRYGQYRRERLIELARRSRACVYLSDSDRGPLALAEILLAGCPAVGVPRGAPWIRDGQTGFQVPTLDFPSLCASDPTGRAIGSPNRPRRRTGAVRHGGDRADRAASARCRATNVIRLAA